MKKVLALLLALVMVLGFTLAGCDGNKPADENGTTAPASDPAVRADSMTLCVGPYPDTIDPALNSSVDGATYIIHAFAGLVIYKQNASGALELVPGCAKAIPEPQVAEDGKTTYVFELRDDLKWSDGTPMTAEDFVYSWNRAIAKETAADYAYMFDVIEGYEEGTLNVTASEDGKTLTVVLLSNAPYFMELCAFPTYAPVKKDVVEGNESWATAVDTYIGNGPYKITEFTQSQLVMEKNENYFDAASIVTDKLIFPFNDDDASLLANFKNKSYLFIDSVPNDEIETIEAEYPDEYKVEGQLGTYYVCFNMNDTALEGFSQEEKVSLRKALGLLIDRNYIVEEIGKAGQVPANGFVAMGLTDADGKTQWIDKNGANRDGSGYFSVAKSDYEANCAEAVALFKEVATSSGKFTVGDDNKLVGFPSLVYITNEGTGHEAIATNLQSLFANYGITLSIEVQEWNTFLNTRKNGEYSIARNGWLADYNDPISFLDMWVSESGNNDCQFGKDAHTDYAAYSYNGNDNLTWAESYDACIAAVKASSDPAVRFDNMHQAEDILMSTGAICPIYYYTDLFMCSQAIHGFFSSPLGYKFFMYAYADK